MSEPNTPSENNTIAITITNPQGYVVNSYTLNVSSDASLEEMIAVFDGILHAMGYYYDGYLSVSLFPKEEDLDVSNRANEDIKETIKSYLKNKNKP